MRSSTWTAAAFAAALAWALGTQAQSTVYQWTDSQGKVHFSDTPPTEQARNVTQKRVGGGELIISGRNNGQFGTNTVDITNPNALAPTTALLGWTANPVR